MLQFSRYTYLQITLVEPGAANTVAAATFSTSPAHKAYAKPDSIVTTLRGGFQTMMTNGADPDLVVEKMYELSQLEQPPLRLPLGKDAVDVIRKQLIAITIA